MAPDGEQTAGGGDALDHRLLSLLAHLREHPVEMVDPPAFLFARIEAELRITTVSVTSPVVTSLDAAREARDARRTRSRPATWLAAAAALVVLGGVGGIATVQRDDPGSVVLASAQLHPVVAAGNEGQHNRFRGEEPPKAYAPAGEGFAQLIGDGGKRTLAIATKHLPDIPAGYKIEVWATDDAATTYHDLGPLPVATAEDATTTLDLPAGVDLTRSPVIELTLEELGSSSLPSSTKLLRGELP